MEGSGAGLIITHLARAADPTAHRRVRNFGLRDLRIIMREEGDRVLYVDADGIAVRRGGHAEDVQACFKPLSYYSDPICRCMA